MLESQVVEIEEDLTGLGEDVFGVRLDLTELEGDVNFLFEETIIQDERIFNLEQTSVGILGDLDLVEDDIDSKFFK